MELLLPFGIGALAAALVCWWPLGRVANVRVRRLLRSAAIGLGIAPTVVSGGYVGFILPAALELYDGDAHANASEILKSGGLILATTGSCGWHGRRSRAAEGIWDSGFAPRLGSGRPEHRRRAGLDVTPSR